MQEVDALERRVGAEVGEGSAAGDVLALFGCGVTGAVHAVGREERSPCVSVPAVEGAGVLALELHDRQTVLEHGDLGGEFGFSHAGTLPSGCRPAPERRSTRRGPQMRRLMLCVSSRIPCRATPAAMVSRTRSRSVVGGSRST